MSGEQNRSPAKPALLMGIGSPFSDDTLGWQLLDALQEQQPDLPGYELVFKKADRPGTGLLDRMQGYEVVVLLDALDAGLSPGSVKLLRKENLAMEMKPASSHSLGVAETLRLGEALQILPANLFLLGIQVGQGLQQQSVDSAVDLLKELFTKPDR